MPAEAEPLPSFGGHRSWPTNYKGGWLPKKRCRRLRFLTLVADRPTALRHRDLPVVDPESEASQERVLDPPYSSLWRNVVGCQEMDLLHSTARTRHHASRDYPSESPKRVFGFVYGPSFPGRPGYNAPGRVRLCGRNHLRQSPASEAWRSHRRFRFRHFDEGLACLGALRLLRRYTLRLRCAFSRDGQMFPENYVYLWGARVPVSSTFSLLSATGNRWFSLAAATSGTCSPRIQGHRSAKGGDAYRLWGGAKSVSACA